jgi:transcriptional regulator with XRE-family HTH domain
MIIGDRLRTLREQKNLSQGDIEKRTCLLRCYISGVENGHTVPSIETLEKMSRALEVPLYQLFYEGENPPALPKYKSLKTPSWRRSGKEARLMAKFHRLLSKAGESDRKLLLHMARKIVDHKSV